MVRNSMNSAHNVFPASEATERLPSSWRESTERQREILESDRPLLYGARSLRTDEISFIYGVARQDERLQFVMRNTVPADEVFGLDPGCENDISLFAYYDMENGKVWDVLDVKIYGDDGSKDCYEYSLSPEEKAFMLSGMDDYCRRKTGMNLAEQSENYRREPRRNSRYIPGINRTEQTEADIQKAEIHPSGKKRNPTR